VPISTAAKASHSPSALEHRRERRRDERRQHEWSGDTSEIGDDVVEGSVREGSGKRGEKRRKKEYLRLTYGSHCYRFIMESLLDSPLELLTSLTNQIRWRVSYIGV
jgi:hypothetical protein